MSDNLLGGLMSNLFPKKYYLVRASCVNCKLVQEIKINKGNIASEAISRGKCNNCGCEGLTLI